MCGLNAGLARRYNIVTSFTITVKFSLLHAPVGLKLIDSDIRQLLELPRRLVSMANRFTTGLLLLPQSCHPRTVAGFLV